MNVEEETAFHDTDLNGTIRFLVRFFIGLAVVAALLLAGTCVLAITIWKAISHG